MKVNKEAEVWGKQEAHTGRLQGSGTLAGPEAPWQGIEQGAMTKLCLMGKGKEGERAWEEGEGKYIDWISI